MKISDASKIMYGSEEVVKVYLGSNIIWSKDSGDVELGVINGELDFSELSYVDGNGSTHTNTNGELTVHSNGNGYARVSSIVEDNSVQKLFVFKCENITGAEEAHIRIYDFGNTNELENESVLSYDQETRIVFSPSDGGYSIRLYASKSSVVDSSKRYYDMRMYDTSDLVDSANPLTSALPADGEKVVGNSIKYRRPDNSTYIVPVSGDVEEPVQIPADAKNVMDYGATGNGITDDTAAFNSAFAAAGDGGTVYMPNGFYTLRHLIIPSNRSLIGENEHLTKIRIDYSQASDHEACIDMYSKDNVTWRNFTFDMKPPSWPTFDPSAWSGKKCAYIRGCRNFLASHVHVMDNEHGAFYIGANVNDNNRRGNNLRFEHCNFTNIDCAINSDRTSGEHTPPQKQGDDYIYVIDCHFDGHNLSEPVFFDDSTHIEIRDCTSKNKWSGSAWRFNGCSDVLIENCTTDTMGNGAYFDFCTDNIVIKDSSFTNSRWAHVEKYQSTVTEINVTKN